MIMKTPKSSTLKFLAAAIFLPAMISLSSNTVNKTASAGTGISRDLPIETKIGNAAPENEDDDQHTLITVDANSTLESTFDSLEARAGNGDAQAKCQLAWALDLCANAFQYKNAADAMAYDTETDPLRPADLARANRTLALSEAVESICRGLGEDRLLKTGDSMLESALAGHVPSMSRFALRPHTGGSITLSNLDLIISYRTHAKEFLDRAAMAGDPAALGAVYKSYSIGYLETDAGKLEIPLDLPRAAAAGSVLALGSDRIERRISGADLRQLIGRMNAQDMIRFRKLEAEYRDGYAKNLAKAGNSKTDALMPDEACRSTI